MEAAAEELALAGALYTVIVNGLWVMKLPWSVAILKLVTRGYVVNGVNLSAIRVYALRKVIVHQTGTVKMMNVTVPRDAIVLARIVTGDVLGAGAAIAPEDAHRYITVSRGTG